MRRTAITCAADLLYAQRELEVLYASHTLYAPGGAALFHARTSLDMHLAIQRVAGAMLAKVPAANDCGGMFHSRSSEGMA